MLSVRLAEPALTRESLPRPAVKRAPDVMSAVGESVRIEDVPWASLRT